jgi:hypothetical protein
MQITSKDDSCSEDTISALISLRTLKICTKVLRPKSICSNVLSSWVLLSLIIFSAAALTSITADAPSITPQASTISTFYLASLFHRLLPEDMILSTNLFVHVPLYQTNAEWSAVTQGRQIHRSGREHL